MSQDEYTIEKGDTLSQIADLYDTTVPELMATNKIENPDRIYPGKKIMLPAPPVPERNPSFSYQQDVRNARLRESPYTPESSTEMERRLDDGGGRLQPAGNGPTLPPMVSKPGEVAEQDDDEFHRFSFLPLGGVPGSGELEFAWPKPLYDAFTGFQKISSGEIEPYIINPETGKQEINPEMIEIATAIAAISMTGGLAGTGGQATKQALTAAQENALIKRATQVAKKMKKNPKLPEGSRLTMSPEDVDELAFLMQTPDPKEFTLNSGIVIKFPGGKKVTQQQAAVDEVARFNELFEKTTTRTPDEQAEFVALAQKFKSDNDALPQAQDMPPGAVEREFATDLEKYGDALIRQRAGEKGFQFKAPKEGQILDFADTRKTIHDFAKANKMTVDEVLAIFRKPNET